MDDAGNEETVLRLCLFSDEVSDAPARQVLENNILVIPDDSTRMAHRVTRLPPRSWCDHCVKGFAMEDHHRRRDRSKATIPESQLDYMLLGTAAGRDSTEPSSMVAILHAVDVVTRMRVAVVGQKAMVEHVVSTTVNFLDELGYQSVLLKSDKELSVTTFTYEVSRRRHSDDGRTTIIAEIPLGNSQVIGVADRGNYQLGCQCRTLRSSVEDLLGVVLLPDLPAVSWLVRHTAWIMNRYEVGRDGSTPYERHKGQPYCGELRELFEVVHWLVPASKERKFDSWTSMGIWQSGNSHLIFDDKVVQVRTAKCMPEEQRWQAEQVLRLDALPWLLRPHRVKERATQRMRRYITWNNIRGTLELQGTTRAQWTRLTTTSSVLNAS